MKRFILLIILIFLLDLAFGQENMTAADRPGTGVATALPDISLVVNTLGNIQLMPPNADTNKWSYAGGFGLSEAELNIEGNIYPEVKAKFVGSASGTGGFSVEEAYADNSAFLDIFGLKFGRSRLDFGKLNKQHPHVWPFSDEPIVLNNFISEMKGDGLTLAYVLPLPFFAQIEGGAYSMLGADAGAFALYDVGYLTRLWTSFSVSDSSELEFGLSGAAAKGPEYTNGVDEVRVGGADLTWKLWILPESRIISQTEFLYMTRNLAENTPIGRWGFYSYLGYRFNRHWETGVRYDMSQSAVINDDSFTNTGSVIVSDYLTEGDQMALRLQYTYDFNHGAQNIFCQFVFALGPHTHGL